MANKRISFNQKGAVSFTVIFLALLLGFIILSAGSAFMLGGVGFYGDDGAQVDPQQQQTFDRLNDSMGTLQDNIINISESVGAIQVQNGFLQTFWNSFLGLGAILKLPITLVSVATDSVGALVGGTELIPVWLQALLISLITILIILAIIAAMTGGNSNI